MFCASLQIMHEQGIEAGIADFICKPFRIEELQEVLKSTPRLKRLDRS